MLAGGRGLAECLPLTGPVQLLEDRLECPHGTSPVLTVKTDGAVYWQKSQSQQHIAASLF